MPEVDTYSRPFWEAWEALSSRRQRTQVGPQAIPISEILAYCDLRRIDDPDEREDMYHMIGMLDGLYLEMTYKR